MDEAARVADENGWAAFVSLQNEYSLLKRDSRPRWCPPASATGSAILPYFPLARGLLTGKYRRGEAGPAGARLTCRGEVADARTFDAWRRSSATRRSAAFAARGGDRRPRRPAGRRVGDRRRQATRPDRRQRPRRALGAERGRPARARRDRAVRALGLTGPAAPEASVPAPSLKESAPVPDGIPNDVPGVRLPKLRFVAAAAAFATLYFVTAELTSSLAGDVGIAVLWPASGVYLGLMLVAPRQLWPALALGAGLGSLGAYAHAGSSLELSVAFAVPSSAEGLLGAVLVERIVRGRFRLGGLRDVSALGDRIAVATALVALSAGAVAAQTFDVSFAESWLRWWSADALGVLAVAPLVVALVQSRDERPSGAELRFCAGVIAVGALAIWAQPTGAAAMAGGALVLPVLLWAGWRWGPRAAAVGGTGVALAAMNLAADSNLLGTSTVDADVHVLQAFLAALLVSSLSFAAAVADWRVERVAAARSSRRLRAITDSSPDAYVTVDSEGLITGWSARAQAMFGIEADKVSGRSLESIAPGAGPVTPTPDARELTLLARHRSGREFPAALTVRPASMATTACGTCSSATSPRASGSARSSTARPRRRSAGRGHATTPARSSAAPPASWSERTAGSTS